MSDQPDSTSPSELKVIDRSSPWPQFTVIAVFALGAIVLALPPLQRWVGIELAAMHREWLEFLKFVVEIVLVLLFGGAVFSEGVSDAVEAGCRRIQDGLDKAHEDIADVLRKVERGEMLTTSEWLKLAKRLMPGRDGWFSFVGVSDFKLMIWLATRGMPKGLFGMVAFLFFLAKLAIDVILLQALPS